MDPLASITVGISIASLLFSAGAIYGKRTKQISELDERIEKLDNKFKEVERSTDSILDSLNRLQWQFDLLMKEESRRHNELTNNFRTKD